MHLILFDDHSRENLLPLTFTRPVADLRVGILTIAQKWGKRLGMEPSFLTSEYLSSEFPLRSGKDNLMLNGSLLPTADLQEKILKLGAGEALKKAPKIFKEDCRIRWDRPGREIFNLIRGLSPYPGPSAT